MIINKSSQNKELFKKFLFITISLYLMQSIAA